MEASYITWLRQHVGQSKVFLPFATVIVRDELNRVLVQRRADFDFWGLPGGVLELYETIEEGARRELREETGLDVGHLRLVGIYTDPKYDVTYPNGDQVQQFTVCLEGRALPGRMQADGVETLGQRFVSYAELASYDLPIWYRDMLDEAQEPAPPQFRPAYAAPNPIDQVATIRPYVGHDIFSGVGSSVVLTDEKGRILMLQHVGEVHWRVPSGYANLGENAAHTAVREIKEELNLDIEPQRIIGVSATPRLITTYNNGDRVRVVDVIFAARVTGGQLHLDESEIADLRWVAPEEAPGCVHPSRVAHYEAIVNHLHKGYFVD